MKREHLQHIIRAASQICEEPTFVIIGSQAVHGSLLDVDDVDLIRSMEADLYPLHAPGKSQRLNEIGEMSRFHERYGYYADGVDDTTATLPQNWLERVSLISGPLTQNTLGFQARGLCPELHDLVFSKLVAGRDKDIVFFRALVRLHKLDATILRDRLEQTELAKPGRRFVEAYIEAAFGRTD